MFRSRNQRQSESARKYLDFAAVSPALENAAEVTARALDFPVAMVNILDDSNQYTLVAFGAGDPRGRVVSLSKSACHTVVELGRTIVVPDVDAGSASIGLPSNVRAGHTLSALRESGVRAYASVPLFGRESVPIGTLCVLDTRPHVLSPSEIGLLEQLAVMVEEHLDVQRGRARIAATAATVAELTAAVDGGQIAPWYEPIVDLRTGAVFAVEALARWEHPTQGIVGPDRFIDQMERTDLIIDLDLAILDRASTDFARWIVDNPDLKLSVNISGHHLERLDCVERIVDAVVRAHLPAQSVVLEVTETARGIAVRDEARVIAALRASGFTVLLDDLGSGWSPVPRLTHVTVDGFKLDRSLAAALHTKVGDAVARAMVQFGVELDHIVVIEGVETRDRLDRARSFGFGHGQGHYFSEAVGADDVPAMLDAVNAAGRGRLGAVSTEQR